MSFIDESSPDLQWETTPWPPDVRACAMPDLKYAILTALGAAVIGLALGGWLLQRINPAGRERTCGVWSWSS